MTQNAPGGRSRRVAGNVLVLVVVLTMLLLLAIFSLGFLTRTDSATTSNLLRELTATSVAESIAAQIEARVNANPWADRFWLLEAQSQGWTPSSNSLPMTTFDRKSAHVDLSRDNLPPGKIEFVGTVKDLPTELRQYRIYVEVQVDGETYAFTWDKKWDQSLLAGMNQDATAMDKMVDVEQTVATTSPTDALLGQIRSQSLTAIQPDGSGQGQSDLLVKLDHDKRTLRATTIAPDPNSATVPAPNAPSIPGDNGKGGGGGKGR